MPRRLLLLVFFLLVFPGMSIGAFAKPVALPPGTPEPLQAVVVIAQSWEAVPATLQLFERESAAAPWKAVGEPYKAVVGRKGLGWGAGIYPVSPGAKEPIKREGDGKAPAGVFRLSSAFGYASPASNSWIKLPYAHATEKVQCVDDPDSPHYNRLVDTSKVAATWKSYEDMLLKDDQYRLGVVVDHNASPVQPGGGSCIFVHIWKSPSTGTSGCTALAPADVEKLLRWLDPAKHPVLVQMPAAAYAPFAPRWGLPVLPPGKAALAR